ncbi:hypothetical protein [Leifsonia shinshuensis]
MDDFVAIVGVVWFAILATAVLVFRRRVVGVLLQLTISERSEEARRRDLGIAVTLLCSFVYVLVASLLAQFVLPAPASLWALGIGVMIGFFLSLLFSIRFQNAGLSVLGRLRRRP